MNLTYGRGGYLRTSPLVKSLKEAIEKIHARCTKDKTEWDGRNLTDEEIRISRQLRCPDRGISRSFRPGGQHPLSPPGSVASPPNWHKKRLKAERPMRVSHTTVVAVVVDSPPPTHTHSVGARWSRGPCAYQALLFHSEHTLAPLLCAMRTDMHPPLFHVASSEWLVLRE